MKRYPYFKINVETILPAWIIKDAVRNARAESQQARAIILLIANVPTHVGELPLLRWLDLHPLSPINTPTEGAIYLREPAFKVPPLVYDELLALRERRHDYEDGGRPEDRMFLDNKGNPLAPSYMTNILKALNTEAGGVYRLTASAFYHTAVARLVGRAALETTENPNEQ